MSISSSVRITQLSAVHAANDISVPGMLQLTEEAARDVKERDRAAANEVAGIKKDIAAAVGERERLTALKDREQAAADLLDERIAGLQAQGEETQVPVVCMSSMLAEMLLCSYAAARACAFLLTQLCMICRFDDPSILLKPGPPNGP